MNILSMRQAKLASLANLDSYKGTKRTRQRYPIFPHQHHRQRQRFFAEIHQAALYNGTGFERPLAEVVQLYDAYADAIVLVTDSVLFDGDPEWVRIAAPLTKKPLIVLDIFLIQAQIDEVYINGADAIILIVALLEKEELEKLYEKASLLGLDVIVEVQDKRELEVALDLGAKNIGINTRDINDLTRIDLAKISQLSKFILGDVHVVAESGIKSPDEVKQYCQDADAVLIGSALLVDDGIETHLERFGSVIKR